MTNPTPLEALSVPESSANTVCLITPPPALVQQWDAEAATVDMPDQVYIATQAARWGHQQCADEIAAEAER